MPLNAELRSKVVLREIFEENSERVMIAPTITTKRPEKRATKPAPGSLKEPRSALQPRRQMRNPIPIQKIPSTFLICLANMGYMSLT
jgi:hypothetical protein